MIRLCLAFLALIASPAFAQPLTIQTDKPGATINRHIFGQFAEHLGEGIYGGVWVGPDSPIPNTRGIRNDVVTALKALKVPNVRWPGGCHADRYDWRDGIGAPDKRRARISMWGNVIDPNTFGTHEFMDFAGQIGADVFINVNMGSNTAQHAADWLEYMTAPLPTALAKERIANGRREPWKIKFVGLGNETWGCGGEMSAETNVEETKRFATFVTSHHPDQRFQLGQKVADPMIRVAVGQDLGKTEFSEALMRAWKVNPWTGQGNFEALSLHYYTGDPMPLMAPATEFDEAAYARILRNTLKMKDMIAENAAIMDRYDPKKQVAMSIDEWGVWLRPEGENFMFLRQQNSLRDAVAAALNFNIFIRNADRVRMANIAQMVNVIQSMILTDGPKMLLTPTYHVHKMYVPFQDATLLPVAFAGGTWRSGDIVLPRVDAVAARGKDGKLWLALTNVDPGLIAEVSLAGYASANGETLTAAKVDAVNSFSKPDAVKPAPFSAKGSGGKLTLKLPSKSVTVVQLEGGK